MTGHMSGAGGISGSAALWPLSPISWSFSSPLLFFLDRFISDPLPPNPKTRFTRFNPKQLLSFKISYLCDFRLRTPNLSLLMPLGRTDWCRMEWNSPWRWCSMGRRGGRKPWNCFSAISNCPWHEFLHSGLLHNPRVTVISTLPPGK